MFRKPGNMALLFLAVLLLLDIIIQRPAFEGGFLVSMGVLGALLSRAGLTGSAIDSISVIGYRANDHCSFTESRDHRRWLRYVVRAHFFSCVDVRIVGENSKMVFRLRTSTSRYLFRPLLLSKKIISSPPVPTPSSDPPAPPDKPFPHQSG